MKTEARIPRLSIEEAKLAAERTGVPAQMAELSVFRVLLHHPDLAKAIFGLLSQLLFRGKLDARLRELVILRIGWVTKSEYEWTQHWRVAERLGISEADMLGVRDWRSSGRYVEAERAVLAAADETLESGAISPETWRACEAALGIARVSRLATQRRGIPSSFPSATSIGIRRDRVEIDATVTSSRTV